MEFYDVTSGQWVSLPSLTTARHSHAMVVEAGRLRVVGGQTGRTLLGDMETFDGSGWVRSRRSLRSGRRGFSVVKVPAERLRSVKIRPRKVTP